jgi:hypothetical protein
MRLFEAIVSVVASKNRSKKVPGRLLQKKSCQTRKWFLRPFFELLLYKFSKNRPRIVVFSLFGFLIGGGT